MRVSTLQLAMTWWVACRVHRERRWATFVVSCFNVAMRRFAAERVQLVFEWFIIICLVSGLAAMRKEFACDASALDQISTESFWVGRDCESSDCLLRSLWQMVHFLCHIVCAVAQNLTLNGLLPVQRCSSESLDVWSK